MRFRSGDWGSARPFSFGWWAIVSDDYVTEEGLTLPRGCMVRYREWYGIAKNAHDQPQYNKGLKLVAEVVGETLWDKEKNDQKLAYGVLDPAAFTQDGGPSLAERIYKGSGDKILFRRADNARVSQKGAMGGWDQLRSRLIGEEIDKPMIVCFNTCHDSVRTIPVLQHDSDKIEDLDTEQEDHAADEWRYACMSRPYIKDAPKNNDAKYSTQQTIAELIKNQRSKRINDD